MLCNICRQGSFLRAWTELHKIQSRERIVDSAAQRFTQKGLDSVSIDNVMQAAVMIGGLATSRAITDKVLREELLQSCLAGVRLLVSP